MGNKKIKKKIECTSADPINNTAHDAVCQSINVNKNTPPLHTIGNPSKKHVIHVPAVTFK